MALRVNGRDIPTDKEGYLKNLSDWDAEVAEALANELDLALTPERWEVIEVLRDFYHEFELSPAMRPFVKRVGQKLGPDKGRSIYLMKLFPPSPAKVASKIAGLPRPDNCL